MKTTWIMIVSVLASLTGMQAEAWPRVLYETGTTSYIVGRPSVPM